ncbi:MAG: GNAT family N-acetyltransferase [Methanomassiliicoccales archaeon]|nr:GNAT family N-acetyltransferase [Methanomassiliicoccales archaeon]
MSVPAESDFQRYKRRAVSPREAVDMIARGKTVFIGTAAGEPQTLVKELGARASEMADNEIIQALSLFLSPVDHDRSKTGFRLNALFVGPEVRGAVQEGRADYTPANLSEIADLLESNIIHVDYALIQVAPPDENGNCSLGVSVDITKSAAKAAETVIAQVNPRMPVTGGDSMVHVSEIDAFVYQEEPLLEWKRPREDEPEVQAIGKHVAALVEDGSTIQIGYGSIPDAVVHSLIGKKDLGVHTEMFSDGLIELIEAGVVTGHKKTLHPGKVVASFVLGSQKLYDYVDRNDTFEFYPSSYTNSPCTIRQNRHMVAINSALSIDLTGQVCADQLEHEFYSGIGGLADFMRGASMSKGGKSIIAIPSTAQNGKVSRIVPVLPEGSAVAVNRCDVHYVVTEFGIAELRGRTIGQRTLELIDVAHPKFRASLLEEAKRLGYLRRERSAAPYAGRPYPAERQIITKAKGIGVRIRALKPSDEEILKELFYSLSEESVHERFLSYEKIMPSEIRNLLNLDYDARMAFVALIREEGHCEAIGIAAYDTDPVTGLAEASFAVRDDFQGQGLGTKMFGMLVEYAKDVGIKGFTAEILPTNIRMLDIFHRSGLKVETKLVEDVIDVRALF